MNIISYMLSKNKKHDLNPDHPYLDKKQEKKTKKIK